MYVNVAAIIDGASAPDPDVFPITEDTYLFYSGEFNLIFGDTESGKTWLCLAAVASVLTEGGKAAIIDLDHNGAPSIISRLQQFGIPDDVLVDQNRFRLAEPVHDLELKELVTDLLVFRADVVTIDSLGEVLPLFRANSNNADDFTVVHTTVIKPLALNGAAVLVIDHLAKNQDSRSQGPTGTMAKSRAVGGLSVRVTAERPFKPGEGGTAKLELFKDRHGGVRKQFPSSEPKPVIGTFTLTADGEALSYSIKHGLTVPLRAQEAGDAKQLAHDVAKLEELAANGTNVTVKAARLALGCGTSRAQAACKALLAQKTA
ncbi:MAG: hypothetical protein QOG19_3111 [Mycobacterium sp.]|nr:hypothetical protein [Mycobacterium sp.]